MVKLEFPKHTALNERIPGHASWAKAYRIPTVQLTQRPHTTRTRFASICWRRTSASAITLISQGTFTCCLVVFNVTKSIWSTLAWWLAFAVYAGFITGAFRIRTTSEHLVALYIGISDETFKTSALNAMANGCTVSILAARSFHTWVYATSIQSVAKLVRRAIGIVLAYIWIGFNNYNVTIRLLSKIKLIDLSTMTYLVDIQHNRCHDTLPYNYSPIRDGYLHKLHWMRKDYLHRRAVGTCLLYTLLSEDSRRYVCISLCAI